MNKKEALRYFQRNKLIKMREIEKCQSTNINLVWLVSWNPFCPNHFSRLKFEKNPQVLVGQRIFSTVVRIPTAKKLFKQLKIFVFFN